MVRQCAWCLRLINSAGERISTAPLPKLYEASHGICGVCGTLWMEQVLVAQTSESGIANRPYQSDEHPSSPDPAVTKLVMDLQRRATRKAVAKVPRPKKGPLGIV